MTWSRNIVPGIPGLKHNRASSDLLESFRGQVFRCTRCGSCLPSCPTYQASGDEAISARGRVKMLEAVLDGALKLTPGLARRFSQCLLCGACGEACPAGIDVPGAILAARRELAASGKQRITRTGTRKLLGVRGFTGRRLMSLGDFAYRNLPADRLLPWERHGRRNFPKPAWRPLEASIPEISRSRKATRRIALFPGCATDLYYQQTAAAAVRVLGSYGYEVILPRGLGCCGMPHRSLGEFDTAERKEREALKILTDSRADMVVTVCSSCALTLKRAADRLAGAPRIVDIHEILAEKIAFLAESAPASVRTDPDRAGRPRLQERLTWHDPCHMSRDLGLRDKPREIISLLPGVEYVEAGEPGCCGGGGLFSLLHYDLALKTGVARAEALAATSAKLVATGCPACRLQLEDMLTRLGAPIRVVHLVELLDGAGSAQARETKCVPATPG